MDDDAQTPTATTAPTATPTPAPTVTTLDPQVAAQLAQLKALQAQLEKSEGARVDADSAAAADGAVLFGYSFAGLMACLVWSTVALGMMRYAKINGQFLWAICGVLLFVLTYLSQNDVVLWAGGAGLIGVTLLVRRFVTF